MRSQTRFAVTYVVIVTVVGSAISQTLFLPACRKPRTKKVHPRADEALAQHGP